MHDKDILYVISVVSNPQRYKRRYELYDKFRDYIHKFRSNVRLTTVELVFSDREPYVTAQNESFRHVMLKTNDELWHKENLINIGIRHLPDTWKYVAWIDADIEFIDPNWANETLHQLHHHKFVQMFDTALDLGPKGETFKIHQGFISQYMKGHQFKLGYCDWHPGYCWAARRDALDHVGGLIDTGILGSSDHHMACALIGQAHQSVAKNLHQDYIDVVMRWQMRAEKYIKRDVGYVPGSIFHHWHGKKADRRYNSRWKILERNKFSPVVDLKKDWQGLWQLEVENERQIKLRDEIRGYFRARNEDSIDF